MKRTRLSVQRNQGARWEGGTQYGFIDMHGIGLFRAFFDPDPLEEFFDEY